MDFLLIAGARLVEGSLTQKNWCPDHAHTWFRRPVPSFDPSRNMHMQFVLHRNVRKGDIHYLDTLMRLRPIKLWKVF